jgi:uncharacterized protein YuzE
MKFTYDPEADAISLFWGTTVAESDEIAPGVILDYDAQGNVVGVEILDASKQIDCYGDPNVDIPESVRRLRQTIWAGREDVSQGVPPGEELEEELPDLSPVQQQLRQSGFITLPGEEARKPDAA